MKISQSFAVVFGLTAFFGVSAPAQQLNYLPAKVYGQTLLPTRGAEMMFPPATAPNRAKATGLYLPSSVTVDATRSPAPVFVADTANNRVLGWRDSSTFVSGAAADIVIGQKDFTSNVRWGESYTFTYDAKYTMQSLADFSSGLLLPTSVVARDNAVFVVDAGNNRILRFGDPFGQWDSKGVVTADLVIGQTSMSGRSVNQGASTVDATKLKTSYTSSSVTYAYQAAVALDTSSNLWVSDSGNHRLLRYPQAKVYGATFADGNTSIEADLVLGQSSFTTATPNPGSTTISSTRNDRLLKGSIRFGGPIAFDTAGNLFFADNLDRVLVWRNPSTSGQLAERILGVWSSTTSGPTINDTTFAGYALSSVWSYGPRGLFTIGDYVYVIDSGFNRILRFDPVSTWATEATLYSPSAKAVYGQPDFNSGSANRWSWVEPSAAYFDTPVAAAAANGEVFIVDQANNRVVVSTITDEGKGFTPATRMLGQFDFALRAPNMLDASGFGGAMMSVASGSTIYSFALGPALAVDHVSDTPHVYIADTLNNRVLCYSDARALNSGLAADIVIGQVDTSRGLVNSPTGVSATPTATGLHMPAAVAVDPWGNLWVADTGNSRVLRFPNPFTRTDGAQTPDLVLGQSAFDSVSDGSVTRASIFTPVSIAFTAEGHVVVADLWLNRVQLFRQPVSTGQSADLILGQADGSSSDAGSEARQLYFPRGLAVDSFGRLFVADMGNKRIQVWDDVNVRSDGEPADNSLPSSSVGIPVSVTLDRSTDKIWIADGGSAIVRRFPSYATMLTTSSFSADFSFNTGIVPSIGINPISIGLDSMGFPLVVDSANRVTMYYPRMVDASGYVTLTNAANGFRRVAPAAIADAQVPGVTLPGEATTASGTPLLTSLGDVEVLVNGVNAPILKVSGETARIIIPKATSTASSTEFLIRRPSTGQILGFDRLSLYTVSPGIFFQGGTPSSSGAAARALNADGTANSSSNTAKVGTEITIFLTGHGNFDGLPDDGAAPGAETAVPGDVTIALLTGSSGYIATTTSSTLDPDEPGVWRVKFKVPDTLTAGTYTVSLAYKSTSALIPPGSSAISVRPQVYISR